MITAVLVVVTLTLFALGALVLTAAGGVEAWAEARPLVALGVYLLVLAGSTLACVVALNPGGR